MRNIWTSNIKSHICADCPNADERDACLTAGLYKPDATLTFLLEKPEDGSAAAGTPLRDRNGGVFKHVFRQAQEQIFRVQYQVLYAAGMPGKKPKKKVLDTCSTYTHQQLAFHRKRYDLRHGKDKEQLHILVTMGAKASRTVLPDLGNLNKERGQPKKTTIAGYDYIVIPTLGIPNIHAKPGVAGLVIKDIKKAIRYSKMSELPTKPSVEELTDEYIIPRSERELEEVVTRILEYTDPEKQDDPDKWPIGLDSETNSLDAWKNDSKVLMISVAWDDRKSTAICLHHPEMPYSEEAARSAIARILACPKPKIFHNMKFDWQFLARNEGFEIQNLWWDTMLAEHFLDEDKKGHYSLGQLASDYCPAYAGYKNQIQESLIEKVKADLTKDLDQDKPDRSVSYLLHPFYPDIEYYPVCEREEAEKLDPEDRDEFFEREKAYIEAHLAGDQGEKTSMRNQVLYRCRKFGFEYPDVIKNRDYAAEIEQQGYEEVPFDVLLVYAATDTDVTRQACKQQRARMYKKGILGAGCYVMRTLYTPGSEHLGGMEFKGTMLDQELIDTYTKEMEETEEEMLQKMRDIVCVLDFNPNSNDQMEDAVVNKLSFPAEDLELTENESVSVTKGWMRSMAEKYDDQRGDFMQALLVYKAASKARGTFMSGFKELSKHDRRIHTSFWLNGTKTGRLSSSDPNLQNVPFYMGDVGDRKGWNIKRTFIPSSPDNAFWQMDISQAEIRVLCAYSEDPELTSALRDGLDTHSFITSKVFDIPYDEIMAGKEAGDPDIKHKRTACKRVVFGTLYGAGQRKIAEQIYGSLSSDPDEKNSQIAFATSVMNTLFQRFPRINKYIETTKMQVISRGYVTTRFGRRRRFDLHNVSGRHRYKAQREAVNFRIQSTSSDLVLRSLIEVSKNIDDIGADMMLTVHDSMAGEIPMKRVSEMKSFFDEHVVDFVREEFDWMTVPFAYDLEVGPSYGEPIEYSLAITPKDKFDDNQKSKYEDLSDRQKSFYKKLQEAL